MTDTKLRFSPLDPREEQFITRAQLSARWAGCSEKAIVRAEKRLGLMPHRILRGILYAMSDVLKIEAEGSAKMPKRFTGLRPDQKAELLRREREEVTAPERRGGTSVSKHMFQPQA
jgi:hypothetical protein